MKDQVLTPKTLAERWSVTPRTIYHLVDKNMIPHFRPGGRLIRFRLSDIERIEGCSTTGAANENTPSPDCVESGPSHGGISEREIAADIRLERAIG